MLHVTNGTSVSIAQTGLPGEVLYWIDILHEGPTPAGLSLEQMSEIRARFLDDADGRLSIRDKTLAEFWQHEEVVLWFEHDLYDQLQLIQILDWFAGRDLGSTRLSLICIEGYLGELNPQELLRLFPTRHEVSAAELKLGAAAWTAFCSPDPSQIENLLGTNTSALPYLAGALTRHLEQFPSARNGLSRSERQILEILSAGPQTFSAAFSAAADREEAVFLGDCVFWRYIERMRDAKTPLVEGTRNKLSLTAAGADVLRGKADAIALNGIDRWLGGVHLLGPDAEWRSNGGRLVRKESTGADRR
jgi:hypothetical protein